MPGQAAKIVLSERQLEILQRITREATAPVRLVQRCRIIILGFEGWLNEDIGREVGLDRKQVGTWRRRWQQSFDALISIECHETAAALRRAIEEVLSDAPRPGSPGRFTAEQVAAIIALACEPPANSGRPIDFWTNREIADEAVKRGLVTSISVSQVFRYLQAASLQPHKSDYWLNTKEKDPEVFERQVQIVCQTYLDAPDLYYQSNTHTVSTDEMTGVQALERIAKTIPMQPGQPERREFEYKRHGTVCLIGNWDVVAGQMIAPSLGPTRTEVDFCWHVHDTVETDPDAGWVFVVDQLNIHSSESLVRYVAGLEDIPRSELGKKRAVGNSQVGGDAAGVSVRHESPCPLCVPAEAHVVAEPDRNDLRYPAASSPATRQLPLSRRTDTASV
jgi:hypothetical protein